MFHFLNHRIFVKNKDLFHSKHHRKISIKKLLIFLVILQHYNNYNLYLCIKYYPTTPKKMTKINSTYGDITNLHKNESKTKIVNNFSGKLEDCPTVIRWKLYSTSLEVHRCY